MASITRDPNTQNAPDYLNMSRGTEKARPIADTSMGDLFKNIAGIGDAGVKFAYKDIDQSIKNNLQDQVDKIRSDFGVDKAAEIAASGQSPTDARGDASHFLFDPMAAGRSSKGAPPGVAKVGNAISDLQTAYDQGKLSDSYYNARLMSLVKEAKANNPGFEEEVDRHIQSITGINPANALRRSLLSDLDMAERARQASANKDETYINSHLQYASPTLRAKIIAGDRSPETVAQFKMEASGAQADEFDLQQQTHKLELALKNNTYDQVQATQVGTVAVNQYVNKQLYEMSDAGGGVAGVMKLMKEHGDKPWSPEELDALRGNWAQARTAVMLGVKNIMSQPAFAKLDPSKQKEIVDNATSRLNDIEQAITNKDYGALQRNATYVEAMKDRDMRTVLQNSDYLRKMQAVNKISGGPEFWNTMMMRPDTPQMSQSVKAMQDLDQVELTTGTGTSLSDQFDRRKGASVAHPELRDPKAYKAAIDNAVTGLSKANSVEIAENHAKLLFGEKNAGFLSKFDPNSMARVYTSLTSPDVTKKMVELGKNNPELFQNYQKWATDSFNTLFRSRIQDLTAEGRSQYSLLDVKWNAGTNQFEVSALPGRERDVRAGGYDRLAQEVRDINSGIKTLEPILKNGKTDLTGALLDVFKANGWAEGKKDPTLFQKMGDYLSGMASGASEKPASGSDFNPGGRSTGDTEYRTDALPKDKAYRTDASAPGEKDLISLDPSSIDRISQKAAALKPVIRAAESGDNYNSVFGTKREYPLTKMTLNQVLDLQDSMKRAGSPSTAIGGYQFLNSTLKGLMKELKMTGNEVFDEKTQDRLADALLQRRGFGDFLDGKINHKQLANNLSQEWAGLPTTEGRSYYEGDGLNHSTVKLRNVLAALKTAGKEFITPGSQDMGNP